MFLRSLRDTVAPTSEYGEPARVDLPVRIGPDMAETAFVHPLRRVLNASDLGFVDDYEIRFDAAGEPVALRLDLLLAIRDPQALAQVTDALEQLDAPAGSTIGDADSTGVVQFGKSEGLGLYLPACETTNDARLAVVEACTDRLEGAGLYQGSATFGDRTALYFYGDSFNRMRAAITFLLGHDPHCRNAFVRRLT